MEEEYGSMKLGLAIGFILSLGALSFAPPALADHAAEASQLVTKANLTLQSFASNPDMTAFKDLAKKARGILISPQVLKGAFIIGGSGGSGVLLARQKSEGPWAGPAFYTNGEARFGLQIDRQASAVIRKGGDGVSRKQLQAGGQHRHRRRACGGWRLGSLGQSQCGYPEFFHLKGALWRDIS